MTRHNLTMAGPRTDADVSRPCYVSRVAMREAPSAVQPMIQARTTQIAVVVDSVRR
jgi:hypothetical protein